MKNLSYLCSPVLTQHTPARMAESVDALVSNTSGAIRAGSTPAPGTTKRSNHLNIRWLLLFF